MSTTLVSFDESVYGSLYFAVVMATACYGIVCMQIFFYFVHYQNDPLHIKTFVAILWVLNTIQEALSVSGAYKAIITKLEGISSSPTATPELTIQYLFTVLVALPTQGFLVHRIYVFSGKNIAAPLIWVVLGIVQLVSILIYVTRGLRVEGGITLTAGTICLSVAAGTDVLIAIAMIFLLTRERISSGFATTAHILQRLTIFAINTGAWTATFALLTIILLHIASTNDVYTVFSIPLCSLYSNTLLANLNLRAYARSERTAHNAINMDLITSSSLRVSDHIDGDQQHGAAKLFSSAR